MAITFIDHSINGKILNAFNNNVVRFGTSSSKTIVNAEITLAFYSLLPTVNYNPDPSTGNYYIASNGNVVSGYGGDKATDFIPVDGGKKYRYSGNFTDGRGYAEYDENQNYIRGYSASGLGINPCTELYFETHVDTRYVRFSVYGVAEYSIETAPVNDEINSNCKFDITPSPERVFYFNFKTAIKKFINYSRFSDNCPFSVVGELWADYNAYISIPIEYKINFYDATSETSTFTYQFIKGVNQLTEKSFFSQRGTIFPLHKPTNNVAYVTFFKGYPFDISLFGEDISIDVDSFLSEAQFLAHDLPAGEVNPQTYDFINTQGVQRLIICKGDLQWDQIFDKYHNISIGNYEVRMRVEDKCGMYFKWHNEYGGWDYWLFEKNYLVDMSDKQKGEIQMDFDNLPDAKSIIASTGKVVEDSLTLFANGVYDYEIQRVLGIARSPKVYMYTGEKDAQNDDDYWIEVQASVANPQYKQSTFRKTISIKVDIPSNYTLEL